MIRGYVHSFFSGGMVDGPGIRTVVFLSGCPLRCQYCHNPDTWKVTDGIPRTLDYVMEQILKYRTYYKTTGGGVTISGGEPFTQPTFLAEILKSCKNRGIHTALDTSGYTSHLAVEEIKEILEHVDLLLLDMKAYYPKNYKKLTGVEIGSTLDFLELSRKMEIPTWIRYVLVPGLTDNIEEIRDLAKFLHGYENVKKIDVLPFHKEGEVKWEKKGIPYLLKDTKPPDSKLLEVVRDIINKPNGG